MKKFFTLIAAALMTLGANAQKAWNFSDWETGSFTETFTKDGLTVTATTDAKVDIDGNSKTVDEVKYTQRLKTGGAASAESRSLSFSVDGACEIAIVACSSNSTDERTLNICAGAYDGDSPLKTLAIAPGNPTKEIYNYEGGATTIYLGSASGGINFYAIYVTPTGEASGDEPGTDETVYYMKKDGDRYVCLSAEEYEKAGISASAGINNPEGVTVLYEDDDLTINPEVQLTIWPASWNGNAKNFLLNDGLDMYINCGSTLPQNNWLLDMQIFDVEGIKSMPTSNGNVSTNQAIISVTPKVNGLLGFGVYASDNSREIGIYNFPQTDEDFDNEDFGFVAVNDFRHGDPTAENDYYDNRVLDGEGNVVSKTDAPEGAVAKDAAFVEGEVKAGRKYLLLSSGTNIALFQVTFKAGSGETGISSAIKDNAVENNVMYNLAGQRIAAPVSGQIYIQNGKKYIAK